MMIPRIFTRYLSTTKAVVYRPFFRNTRPKKLDITPQQQLLEAKSLVESLDWKCVHSDVVTIREINPATLLGSGKLQEISMVMQSLGAHVLVIDGKLSSVQQRNISNYIEERVSHKGTDVIRVLDRFSLVLSIFEQRAQSKQSKLQVELASIRLQKSRLINTDKAANERFRVGVGRTGGFGETQLEVDRRRLVDKEKKLRDELEAVARIRQTMRGGRVQKGMHTVAIIGYTNSGKSALSNRLTGLDHRESTDRLFASLDTNVRRISLPSGRPCLLADTVGFISELPDMFETCFESTLEEAIQADVLLHVRDATNPAWEYQKDTVMAVVAKLGCAEKLDSGGIEVINKIDALDNEAMDKVREGTLGKARTVMVSAKLETNCDRLLRCIDDQLDKVENRR